MNRLRAPAAITSAAICASLIGSAPFTTPYAWKGTPLPSNNCASDATLSGPVTASGEGSHFDIQSVPSCVFMMTPLPFAAIFAVICCGEPSVLNRQTHVRYGGPPQGGPDSGVGSGVGAGVGSGGGGGVGAGGGGGGGSGGGSGGGGGARGGGGGGLHGGPGGPGAGGAPALWT